MHRHSCSYATSRGIVTATGLNVGIYKCPPPVACKSKKASFQAILVSRAFGPAAICTRLYIVPGGKRFTNDIPRWCLE